MLLNYANIDVGLKEKEQREFASANGLALSFAALSHKMTEVLQILLVIP